MLRDASRAAEFLSAVSMITHRFMGALADISWVSVSVIHENLKQGTSRVTSLCTECTAFVLFKGGYPHVWSVVLWFEPGLCSRVWHWNCMPYAVWMSEISDIQVSLEHLTAVLRTAVRRPLHSLRGCRKQTKMRENNRVSPNIAKKQINTNYPPSIWSGLSLCYFPSTSFPDFRICLFCNVYVFCVCLCIPALSLPCS